MKHLRYCYLTANDHGIIGNACEVVRKLGITYQLSTPQSIADQFWFWNCANIPAKLPPYITELNVKPMDCIGWGLSREEAELLS